MVRLAATMTAGLVLLAACAPSTPTYTATGVGFDNSIEAQRAREAALAGEQATATALPPPTAISNETLPPAPGTTPELANVPAPIIVDGSDPSAAIAAETAAALNATTPGAAPVPQSGPVATSTGLSRENDFEAVAGQRSIESDAARIEANQQQYQVVAPTEVPERPGSGEPNVVSYALATNHPPGTRLYSRSGINLQARAERNCRRYSSPDQAQLDFLGRGGPEQDRIGLDPDGDGYACAWDPTPFRRAVQN